MADAGYVFAGSDYNALETRVGAIVTGDKALRKMLLEGYDSHAMYAAVYFADELKERGLPYGPDITVEDSLLIKEEASDLRQKGKAVTFALQYGGTEHTVAKSLEVSLEEAKKIVDSYHKLHSGVSDYYTKMTEAATKCGYYTIETGLRLRAPGLQSIDDKIVEKTKRSATNALIQGFGMLTVKAMNKFQERIEQSGYDSDVQIINTIHDAVYLRVRDNVNTIKWVNNNLIDCMVEDFADGQDIPLEAELDVGYSWVDQRTLPNNCSEEEIENTLNPPSDN